MSLDPKTYELLARSLTERGDAIREQGRLTGIIGKIAHVVSTAPDDPAIVEIRSLVNEAMGREVFPPGYTSTPPGSPSRDAPQA